MTAPVGVAIRHERPCLVLQIEDGVAVSAPALLVKAEIHPLGTGAGSYGVNSDHPSRRRRGPLGQIRRWSTIDRLVVNVDKLILRSIRRIDAEKFCVAVLNAGSGSRADPVILTDNSGRISNRIAVWRPAEVGRDAGGFIVFGDLVPV